MLETAETPTAENADFRKYGRISGNGRETSEQPPPRWMKRQHRKTPAAATKNNEYLTAIFTAGNAT